MRESGAVVVSGAIEKNLSLAVESAEGSAVDDPRAVTLDFGAVTVTGLQVESSGGAIWRNRPWRKLPPLQQTKPSATKCTPNALRRQKAKDYKKATVLVRV